MRLVGKRGWSRRMGAAAMAVTGVAVFALAPDRAAAAGAVGPAAVTDHTVASAYGYVGSRADQYAGAFVDRKNRVLTVYTADPAASSTYGLSTAQSTADTAARWTVRTVRVAHSMAYLKTVERSVPTRQPFAALTKDTLSEYWSDPVTDQVHVCVTQITPAVRAAAKSAFGDDVVLCQETRPQYSDLFIPASQVKHVVNVEKRLAYGAAVSPMSAPSGGERLYDNNPYKGGIRIWHYTSTGYTVCTAGFPYISASYSIPQMLTAGHCAATGTDWYSGWYDYSTQTMYNAGYVGVMGFDNYRNNSFDAGLITARYGVSYTPWIYAGGVWTDVNYPAGGAINNMLGDLFCNDGSYTGENCSGKIDRIGTNIVYTDGVNVGGLDRGYSTDGSNLVQSGDSGGPVVSGNMYERGIDSGENDGGTILYFTPWDTVNHYIGGYPEFNQGF